MGQEAREFYFQSLACGGLAARIPGFHPSWKKMLIAQSSPTLWNAMDCSLPGSSVHRIIQPRIPEWVAIPFSSGSSQPRDWTQVSHIADAFFTIWATRVASHQLEPKFLEGRA